MQRHQGFTLIELSIVLVIIGLIIGGVLVGRDMIHAAQIRATISQPPDHGAEIIRVILEDKELRAEWKAELEQMRLYPVF